MLKTKIKWGVAAAVLLMGLSGCGQDMPNVTDEQMDEIGKYAAVMLLKYDANNRSRLVDDETIAAYDKRKELYDSLEQKKPDKETNDKDNTGSSGESAGGKKPAQEAPKDRLEDFFQLPEGVGIVFSGYAVADSYPDGNDADSFFTLDATEGKKLLVLKFIVANAKEQAQKLDFFSYNATYKITVNGEQTRAALTTMLLNDLSSFAGEVEGNGGRELVLLAEMDTETLNKIETIVLQPKNETKTCTIPLKP